MAQNPLRLKNHVLLMALAAAYPVVSYGAAAARVDFAVGTVQAVAAGGAQRPLSKGAEISAGETIRTGDDGRAQLRFADGALMSLQPRTEFRIDAYTYASKGEGGGSMDMPRKSAVSDCAAGRTEAGIRTMEDLLRRNGYAVPPP